MAATSTPGPRAIVTEVADRDAEKYFPNGIAATMLAIQRNWDAVANGGPRDLSARKFCDEAGFAAVYKAVQALYPRRKQIDNVRKIAVSRSTNQGKKDSRNIDFADMRAFADFVGGFPTGLFLLFTQFVSNERHAGEDRQAAHKEAVDLIEGVRRVVDAAEQYIKNRPVDRPLFIDDGARREYMADMEAMKVWVDAFKPRSTASS